MSYLNVKSQLEIGHVNKPLSSTKSVTKFVTAIAMNLATLCCAAYCYWLQ
jgi:hypothetical protein